MNDRMDTGSDYSRRVEEQIAQYAEVNNIHDLPEIFHVWSDSYLRPPLTEVFGAEAGNVSFFYASAFEAAIRQKRSGRILSVGCGDGTIEIGIAKELLGRGYDVELIASDISPILLDTLRSKASEAGVSGAVIPTLADLNKLEINGNFDLIMAHHALHHIVELEGLFDFAVHALSGDGVFATQDMIGRNGHQRWPEVQAVLEALWPTLTEKQRFHHLLRRPSTTFLDHDCSTEGFEGIRSQDILPLMLDRFYPARFVGAGGLIDIFVDRGYGPAWNVANTHDVATIRWFADLNEMLLDAGIIKPTIMFAWFTKYRVPEIFYRGRSARSSVREVAGTLRPL